eukprot:SAG22_NODE_166_length_16765_cov_30.782791_8_plen_127_part_00
MLRLTSPDRQEELEQKHSQVAVPWQYSREPKRDGDHSRPAGQFGPTSKQQNSEMAAARPAATKKTVKVLYLHGLEETEKSPKPQTLAYADHIELCVPALHVYFSHRNGPIVGELRINSACLALCIR